MHKSKTYGKLLLKQKYKQTESKVENFALMLDNALNFKLDIIHEAVIELLDEDVLFIDDDFLCQKRMIKDNDLSEKRAESGAKGGRKPTDPTDNNVLKGSKKEAKVLANAVNGNVIETVVEINSEIEDLVNFPRENFDEREIQFCDDILDFFGFDEVKHFKNFVLFHQAYGVFNLQGTVDHFIAQCNSYKKYIEHIGERYKLGFDKFLGKQESGFDGAWNNENWEKKLLDALNEKKSGVIFPTAWDQAFFLKQNGENKKLYEDFLKGKMGGRLDYTATGYPIWKYPTTPKPVPGSIVQGLGNIGKEKKAS